ncbi:acyl carrier protein [Streptomyces dangxiongensis]|uniref:acyl carrier protein n=1 Tax=Streptomyces dangxiongensis TaxID=1442032 RepID=UPI0013CF0693|nr:acyl carrier protein [Streptomyces dangxiongensis]
MITNLVTGALVAVSGRPPVECAEPGRHLFHDLGLDSLGLMETVTALEKLVRCTIPDEITGQLATVGDLRDAVYRCASGAPRRIAQAEEYLGGHTSLHFERAARFRAASERLRASALDDSDILVDLGAGLTELDYVLRAEYGWRGRYVAMDVWVDGTFDLDTWRPARPVGWYAALEVLEHLADPEDLVRRMKESAAKGFVVTTPNSGVMDVLAQDPTHVTPLDEETLQSWGLTTSLHNFYGQYQDGICGLWRKD